MTEPHNTTEIIRDIDTKPDSVKWGKPFIVEKGVLDITPQQLLECFRSWRRLIPEVMETAPE